MSTSEQRIQIAVQKTGRLTEHSIDLLERCGLRGFAQSEVPLEDFALSLCKFFETGLDRLLVAGQWFANDTDPAVIISRRMADNLGIRLDRIDQTEVTVWGTRYKVRGVFDDRRLETQTDLDGEPLTPVTFPSEVSTELTEIEMEALESGEDVEAFQSRYQHTAGDLTVYMPYRALQAIGGRLKAVAVIPPTGIDTREAAQDLADRFGLELFSGEK